MNIPRTPKRKRPQSPQLRSRPEPWLRADLDDTSDDADVLKKHPKNSWKREQKIALLLLVRLYLDKNWSDLHKVFEQTFRADLLIRGFLRRGTVHNRLTIGALRSQYDQLVRSNSSEYVQVNIESEFGDLTKNFCDINNRLRSAAEEVAVQLQPRQFEAESTTTRRRSKITKRAYNSADSEGSSSDTLFGNDSESENDDRCTRFRAPRKSFVQRNKETYIPKEDGLPLIAFRVYSNGSAGKNSADAGFTAGAFCSINADAYEPAPQRDEERLVQYAAHHLNRDKIPSPLISISDSLIWSLSRCAELKKKGISPRIATLNVRAIDAPIFESASLCKATVVSKLNTFNTSYKGAFEYLVWKQILPGSAIISDIPFSQLCDFSRSEPSIARLLQMELIMSGFSVRTVRKRLNPPISETWRIGTAVGKLVALFMPTIRSKDPVFANFTRVILQNWKLSTDLDSWKGDKELLAAMDRALHEPAEAIEELQGDPNTGVRTIKGVFVTTPPNALGFPPRTKMPTTPKVTFDASKRALSPFGLPTPSSSGEDKKNKLEVWRSLWIHSPYEPQSKDMECDSPCQLQKSRLESFCESRIF